MYLDQQLSYQSKQELGWDLQLVSNLEFVANSH